LHPTTETVAISHWPKIRNFVFTQTDMLPAPSLSDLDWRDAASMALAEPFDVARRHARGVPLLQQTPWPQPAPLALASAAVALPVPAQNIFEIEENPRATAQSLLPFSRYAEQSVPTLRQRNGVSKRIAVNAAKIRGKPHFGAARKPAASRFAGRANRSTAGAHRGPLKHVVQVKKKRSA
jgi:hypothetical protein